MQSKKVSGITSILITLPALAACFFLGCGSPVHAQQSSSTIAQGFKTNLSSSNLKAGALMSFKSGNPEEVELATESTADNLAGVLDNTPLVAISSSAKQQAQVVLSGTTDVLVSDINGPIKAGDKITASPIAGIGMLATSDSQIVGTAQADFNISNSKTQSIIDRNGKSHIVHIGYVSMQVGIAFYQAPGSNFLPPFIQNIANSVAGRQASLLRILISGVLLLIGFIYASILVYTSVRSAVSSIGRNPLASSAIRKGVYQISLVSLVVVAVALLGSYLILRI